MRPAVVLTALLVLGTVAPAGTALAQEQTTLTVIVETGDGTRVQGAEVTATWDGGSDTGTTKANGKEFLDVRQGARVEISVSDDTYARNFPYVVSDADGQTVTVEVRPAGSTALRVENTEGEPLEEAVVVVRQSGREVTRVATGSNGRATVDSLEQGSYRLVGLKNGHYVNSTDLEVDGDVSKRIVLEEGSEQVEFRVFDGGTQEQQRLTGVTLEVADRATIRTRDSNTASIGLPVNTGFPVTASKEGYVDNRTDIYVNEGGTTVTLLLRREPALNVSLTNDRVVAGESVRVDVVDEYGNPVEGAAVSVDGQQVATTDDRGVASVPIDETGQREIRVTSGGLSATVTVEGVREATEATTTAEPTTTVRGTPAGGIGLPGFTPLAAVLAVLALGGLLALRRH